MITGEQAKQFNEERFKDYDDARYSLDKILLIEGFKTWVQKREKSTLNCADIGCGKGYFLRDLTETLHHRYQINFNRKVGIDLVINSTAEKNYQEIEFKQVNIDGNKLPFEDNIFDLITCNHVLEHIFYTEKLIQEFKRIIKQNGICIISVPNLSAWINRLFLLFSIQPLSCEVGTNSIDYGLWLPYFKKHVNNLGVGAAGHIRSFTPRSLQDIVENSGGGVKSLLKQ
jgi:ubiquinone/menaquinone biosynthesis C-methylase UbiE